MPLNFDDFQKQDISFDISELRNACDEVLKIKGFDTTLGIPHFAGILEVFFGQSQIPLERKL